MSNITCGDAVEWAKNYQGAKFHSLFCDPPYHLLPINSRFGKKDAAPAKFGTDGAYQRMSKGFMGAAWDGHSADGSLIAFDPATWAAFYEILLPGAFCMAFASSRGFHRQACAIEDAGFILHPFIAWGQGAGFPKATRIDTQIDREAGVAVKQGKAFNAAGKGSRKDLYENDCGDGTRLHEPATDLARAWSGHRYGLQALKPAVEPILVFQKPYSGRPLDCITQTGAGALNIAGGRISGTAGIRKEDKPRNGGVFAGNQTRPYIEEAMAAGVPARPTYETAEGGRWPSNLVLDPEAAAMIDAQSGILTTHSTGRQSPRDCSKGPTMFGSTGSDKPYIGDSGGASRFFFNVQTAIEDADPVLYRAKAGRTERDAGVPSRCMVKMRDDLTAEQREYVQRELTRCGVAL